MAALLRISTTALLMLLTLTVAAQQKPLRSYYDENKEHVKEAYHIQNNKLHGKYTAFYLSGITKTEGQYLKGEPSGIWKYYYESGRLKMEGVIEQGVNTDEWRYYFENGNTRMRGQLMDNKREGEWQFFYEDGDLKYVGGFKEGQRDGHWTYFSENGRKKASIAYTLDTGIYRETYPNDTISMKGTLIRGVSQGMWEYFHENGKLKAVGEEKDGKRTGRWHFYDSDGKLISVGDYTSGVESGQWVYYHENGEIKSKGKKVKGEKHGDWKQFYPTGEFRSQASLIHGSGPYKEYYASGKLKAEGTLVDGLDQGKWKYYYEDGQLEGEANYHDGKGSYIGYFPTGEKKMEGRIENGKKVEEWSLFNEDGSLAGLYRPFYDQPLHQAPALPANEDSVGNNIVLTTDSLPEARVAAPFEFKLDRKNRNFKSHVNEYRTMIVGINPMAPVVGSLPVYFEFYLQERMGFEFSYAYVHDPFFRFKYEPNPSDVLENGHIFSLKHKLYRKNDSKGMVYAAQELRLKHVTFISHYADDSTGTELVENTLEQRSYEYTVMVGDRLMYSPKKPGFTLDVFLGLGLGKRETVKGWSNSQQLPQFYSMPGQGYYIPFRIGFSVGYAF